MSRVRIALGIRAQLLLVLTVFLAIPWLGYEYVRELERFLRDAQEKTLAGTAQAVATALHDRPRLFDAPAAPREPLGVERPAREVDGALSGILTVDRRPTPDGKAVIVSAAHPIWVGDQVKGAVIVEETTNAVLAERNRAFERLFSIVLAALLMGSVALTLYASRLSARIRKLRDEAEAAIDAQGRVRGILTGSSAGDEIGDLSRSFSSVLSRLAQYASYREQMP